MSSINASAWKGGSQMSHAASHRCCRPQLEANNTLKHWISPSIPCLSTRGCLHLKMVVWAHERDMRVCLKPLPSSSVRGHEELNWLCLDAGPQSLLKYYFLIAILSWGSSLAAPYLTKQNKKSNLAWFPLFQLWFLLWLILISYKLCSVSSWSCFWINPCCLQCAMTRGPLRLFVTLFFAVVSWCIDR